MPGERRSVHVGGDDRISIERLLDGNAANERRDFAGNFVESAEHDVLAGGLHSGTLQDIAQAWAGKAGCANRALAPLNAGDLGAMQAASVAGAFEGVDDRVSLDFRKLGEIQGDGF